MIETLPARPLFIAIEGIDGAGKSTLTHALAVELRRHRRHVIETREPWEIRPDSQCHLHNLLLATLDRSIHGEQVSRWLEAGQDVITDRYFWSSAAYQQCADPDVIWRAQAGTFRSPDLWIYLTTDRVLCRRRVLARDDDTFDVREMERVAARYDTVAHLAQPLTRINAAQMLHHSVSECLDAIIAL